MSLIQCPECGREVSDQAAACVHCGYPLFRGRANERYTLVLPEAVADPDAAGKIVSQYLTLSVREAVDLLSQAPTVLAQDLTRREARNIAAALSVSCTVRAVLDQDAATREDALCAPPADLDAPVEHQRHASLPLSFWQTVGAILTALALWTVGSAFLTNWLPL